MSARMIGVDVGGTFTDVFVLNEQDGTAEVAKVPTTRPDQSAMVFWTGSRSGWSDLSEISVVIHGTTAGTNALAGAQGCKNRGHLHEGLRDVLEMRRRDRPRTWGLRGDFEPVVDRRDRLEVPERTLADGSIRTPVDLEAVRDAARQLREQGCEAVAILFANAYANAQNEAAAVEAVREIWPNPHVSASSEILPEIREFERFSTTALNAYLQPEVSGYLHRLENALKAGGFDGEFMIVQSNGGVMAVDTACRLPVRTALSGPVRRRDRRGLHRFVRRISERHHGRHGRHQLRRLAHFGRAFHAFATDLDRFRHGGTHAHDRNHHHRRGRWLDCLGGQGRPPQYRSGKRRIGPRPGRLRPRQHPSDGDRCQRRSGTHRSGQPDRRKADAA